MVEIQDKLVTHIATLARLSLSKEETTALAHDLRDILKYAESLESINLEGVPPMSHPTEGERFRPDEPKHDLTRDQALQNAPDQEGGLFRVPQVIGG
ncbi:MAG: Asp-tRNA(Asn)/Glu-tRNA(Gln) amidotransferase subunit GatC [Vicinamibacteria bacterium]|nr:Asp-tRNA(Asn)/Glu-tRNA(Gln) amidotransferase subunit GatC [Vicinamibacteria bacterium]